VLPLLAAAKALAIAVAAACAIAWAVVEVDTVPLPDEPAAVKQASGWVRVLLRVCHLKPCTLPQWMQAVILFSIIASLGMIRSCVARFQHPALDQRA
jgi:hypothetical protein